MIRLIAGIAMFLALFTLASEAWSQEVDYVPLDADQYEVKYTIDGTTVPVDDVCFFPAGADVTDKGNALHCGPPVAQDGTTVTFVPITLLTPTDDLSIVGHAYRALEDRTLISIPSNTATFRVRPRPVFFISGEGAFIGDVG